MVLVRKQDTGFANRGDRIVILSPLFANLIETGFANRGDRIVILSPLFANLIRFVSGPEIYLTLTNVIVGWDFYFLIFFRWLLATMLFIWRYKNVIHNRHMNKFLASVNILVKRAYSIIIARKVLVRYFWFCFHLQLIFLEAFPSFNFVFVIIYFRCS